MSDYLAWRDAPSRRSRAGIRHDDGPIPPEYARRTRRQREQTAWLLLIIGALSMLLVTFVIPALSAGAKLWGAQ